MIHLYHEYVYNLLQPYIPLITGVLAAMVTVLTYDLVQKWRNEPSRKAKRLDMADRRRERWVRSWMADMITNGIEEGYYKGNLSKDERDTWLYKIGHRCDIIDLIPKRLAPKPPDPDELKTKLKAKRTKSRLASILFKKT